MLFDFAKMMGGTFAGLADMCDSLQSVDFSGWKFGDRDELINGTVDMAIVFFAGCPELKTVNLSNWENFIVAYVVNDWFFECSSLEVIDLRNSTMQLGEECEIFSGNDLNVLKTIYAPAELNPNGGIVTLPKSMYLEGTSNEVFELSSETNRLVLVSEANSYASSGSGSQVPSTGFDGIELIGATTLGIVCLAMAAYAVIKTKKQRQF